MRLRERNKQRKKDEGKARDRERLWILFLKKGRTKNVYTFEE